MNSELSNPETFVGTLYPRKFESEKTPPVNAFRKQFEWICTIVCFTNSEQYISTTSTVKNSQNNINNVKIMLRTQWQFLCQAVQCKCLRIRGLKKQGIRIFSRI